MRYEIAKLKTLAVVAAERATGKPVKPFGTTWIDYRGPVETFKTISFSDALHGKAPPGFFKDKIVVVGPWASTFQDQHPVSFGNDLMPGPEIQANAISTVLRGESAGRGAGLDQPRPDHRPRHAGAALGPPLLPARHAPHLTRRGGALPRLHAVDVQPGLDRVVRLSVRDARPLVGGCARSPLPARGVRARARARRLLEVRAGSRRRPGARAHRPGPAARRASRSRAR